MSKVIGNLVKAVALLVGAPAVALFAYDLVAVRPHLAQIEGILAQADPQDANPPGIIRDLIDANAGSPTPHATRLVIFTVYPDGGRGAWHLRTALWGVLLPVHFGNARMYGLYSTLSYNGTDHGLSRFARREYGRSLAELSPMQAATTVAIAHAPATYIRDRGRLGQRAVMLLKESRRGP